MWVAELHGDYFFRDCGAPDTGEATVSFYIVIGFKNEAKANKGIQEVFGGDFLLSERGRTLLGIIGFNVTLT